jgi:hypothetical protein
LKDRFTLSKNSFLIPVILSFSILSCPLFVLAEEVLPETNIFSDFLKDSRASDAERKYADFEREAYDVGEASSMAYMVDAEGRAFKSLGCFFAVLSDGKGPPVMFENRENIPDNYDFYYKKSFGRKVCVAPDTGEFYLSTDARDKETGGKYKVKHGPVYVVLSDDEKQEFIVLDAGNIPGLYAKGWQFFNSGGEIIYYRQMMGYTPYVLLSRTRQDSDFPDIERYFSKEKPGFSEFIVASGGKETFVCALPSKGSGPVFTGRHNIENIIPVFTFPCRDSELNQHRYYSTDIKGNRFELDRRDPGIFNSTLYEKINRGKSMLYRLAEVYMVELKFNGKGSVSGICVYPTLKQAKKRRAELKYNFTDEDGNLSYAFCAEPEKTYVKPDADMGNMGIDYMFFQKPFEEYREIYIGAGLGSNSPVALAESGFFKSGKKIITLSDEDSYLEQGWVFFNKEGFMLRCDSPGFIDSAVTAADEKGNKWSVRQIYFAVRKDDEYIVAFDRRDFLNKFKETDFFALNRRIQAFQEVKKADDRKKEEEKLLRTQLLLKEICEKEGIECRLEGGLFAITNVKRGLEAVLREKQSRADAVLDKPNGQPLELKDIISVSVINGKQAQAAFLEWLRSVAEIDVQKSGDINVIFKFGLDFDLKRNPGFSEIYGLDLFYKYDPSKSARVKQAETAAERDESAYRRWQLNRALEVYVNYNEFITNKRKKEFFRRTAEMFREQTGSLQGQGSIISENRKSLEAALEIAETRVIACEIREKEIKRDFIATGLDINRDYELAENPVTPEEFIDILSGLEILDERIPREILEKKLSIIWSGHVVDEALAGPWVYVFGVSLGWPQLIKPIISIDRKTDLDNFEVTAEMARTAMRRHQVEYLETSKRYREEKELIETALPRIESLIEDMDSYVDMFDESLEKIKDELAAGSLPPDFTVLYSSKVMDARNARDEAVCALNETKAYYEARLRDLKLLDLPVTEERFVGEYKLADVLDDIVRESEEVGDLALSKIDIEEARLKLWEAKQKPLVLLSKITPYVSFEAGDISFNSLASVQTKGMGWKYLIEFLELDVRVSELENEYIRQNLRYDALKAYQNYIDAELKLKNASAASGAWEDALKALENDRYKGTETLLDCLSRLKVSRINLSQAEKDVEISKQTLAHLTGTEFEKLDRDSFNMPVEKPDPVLRLQILRLRKLQAEMILNMIKWDRTIGLESFFSLSELGKKEKKLDLGFYFSDYVMNTVRKLGFDVWKEKHIIRKWDNMINREMTGLYHRRNDGKHDLRNAMDKLRVSIDYFGLSSEMLKSSQEKSADILNEGMISPYDILFSKARLIDAGDSLRNAYNEFICSLIENDYFVNAGELLGAFARQSDVASAAELASVEDFKRWESLISGLGDGLGILLSYRSEDRKKWDETFQAVGKWRVNIAEDIGRWYAADSRYRAAEAESGKAFIEEVNNIVSLAVRYEYESARLERIQEEIDILRSAVDIASSMLVDAKDSSMEDKLFRAQLFLFNKERQFADVQTELKKLKEHIIGNMIKTGEFAYILPDGTLKPVELHSVTEKEFNHIWKEYRKKHPSLKMMNAYLDESRANCVATDPFLNFFIPTVEIWFSLPDIVTNREDEWVSYDGSEKNKDVSATAMWTIFDAGKRASENIKATVEHRKNIRILDSQSNSVKRTLEIELESVDTRMRIVNIRKNALDKAQANISSVLERYRRFDTTEDELIVSLEQWEQAYASYMDAAADNFTRCVAMAEIFNSMGIDLVSARETGDEAVSRVEETDLDIKIEPYAGSDLKAQTVEMEWEKDSIFISSVEEILKILGPSSVDIIEENEWVRIFAGICRIHKIQNTADAVEHMKLAINRLPVILERYNDLALEVKGSKDYKRLNTAFPDFFGTFFYPLTTQEKSGQVNNPEKGSYPLLFNVLGMADYLVCLERSLDITWAGYRSRMTAGDKVEKHLKELFETLSRRGAGYEIWRVRLENLIDRVCLPQTNEQKRASRVEVVQTVSSIMGRPYEPDSRTDSIALDLFFRYIYEKNISPAELDGNLSRLEKIKGICEQNFVPEPGTEDFYRNEMAAYLRYLIRQREMLLKKKNRSLSDEIRIEELEKRIKVEEKITYEAITAVAVLDMFTGLTEGIIEEDDFEENLAFMQKEIIPIMKGPDGKFIEGFDYPLFDAVHLANSHLKAFPSLDAEGRKIIYYVDERTNEIMLFYRDERNPRKIYKGLFDPVAHKVRGWLFQEWNEPKQIRDYKFEVPDGTNVMVKLGDRLEISEFNKLGEKIKDVYLYKERNKEKLTVSREMVSIDEVPNRKVEETWVSLFDKRGEIILSQGWIAGLNKSINGLVSTEGFAEPVLKEYYKFEPNYKYTDAGGKTYSVTRMEGERYNILSGKVMFRQSLHSKFQPDYGKDVLVESVIEDSGISERYTFMTAYKSRETGEKDERGRKIIEIGEEEYIVSNLGRKDEKKRLMMTSSYIYRGVDKETGLDAWEQVEYHDYSTGAWMKLGGFVMVDGVKMITRSGRDRLGHNYTEVGGTIIQYGAEGSPTFVPTPLHKIRYEEMLPWGDVKVVYDRDSSVTEIFKYSDGPKEFKPIRMESSLIEKDGEEIKRTEPRVMRDGTVFDGEKFIFPGNFSYKPDPGRFPKEVLYKFYVKQEYDEQKKDFVVTEEHRIIEDREEKLYYKVMFDAVEKEIEVYEFLPEAEVTMSDGRRQSHKNVMKSLIYDKDGELTAERYHRIVYDRYSRSKDVWYFLQSDELLEKPLYDYGQAEQIIRIFIVDKGILYHEDGSTTVIEKWSTVDGKEPEITENYLVHKDFLGDVISLDSNGVYKDENGREKHFVPQSYKFVTIDKNALKKNKEPVSLMDFNDEKAAEVYYDRETDSIKSKFYCSACYERVYQLKLPDRFNWIVQTKQDTKKINKSFGFYDIYAKPLYQEIFTVPLSKGEGLKYRCDALMFNEEDGTVTEYFTMIDPKTGGVTPVAEKTSILIRQNSPEEEDIYLVTENRYFLKKTIQKFTYEIDEEGNELWDSVAFLSGAGEARYPGIDYNRMPLASKKWEMNEDGTQGKLLEYDKFLYYPVNDRQVIIEMTTRSGRDGKPVPPEESLQEGQKCVAYITDLAEDSYSFNRMKVVLSGKERGQWTFEYPEDEPDVRRVKIPDTDSYVTIYLERNPETKLYSISQSYYGKGGFEFFDGVRDFVKVYIPQNLIDPVTGEITDVGRLTDEIQMLSEYKYDEMDRLSREIDMTTGIRKEIDYEGDTKKVSEVKTYKGRKLIKKVDYDTETGKKLLFESPEMKVGPILEIVEKGGLLDRERVSRKYYYRDNTAIVNMMDERGIVYSVLIPMDENGNYYRGRSFYIYDKRLTFEELPKEKPIAEINPDEPVDIRSEEFARQAWIVMGAIGGVFSEDEIKNIDDILINMIGDAMLVEYSKALESGVDFSGVEKIWEIHDPFSLSTMLRSRLFKELEDLVDGKYDSNFSEIEIRRRSKYISMLFNLFRKIYFREFVKIKKQPENYQYDILFTRNMLLEQAEAYNFIDLYNDLNPGEKELISLVKSSSEGLDTIIKYEFVSAKDKKGSPFDLRGSKVVFLIATGMPGRHVLSFIFEDATGKRRIMQRVIEGQKYLDALNEKEKGKFFTRVVFAPDSLDLEKNIFTAENFMPDKIVSFSIVSDSLRDIKDKEKYEIDNARLEKPRFEEQKEKIQEGIVEFKTEDLKSRMVAPPEITRKMQPDSRKLSDLYLSDTYAVYYDLTDAKGNPVNLDGKNVFINWQIPDDFRKQKTEIIVSFVDVFGNVRNSVLYTDNKGSLVFNSRCLSTGDFNAFRVVMLKFEIRKKAYLRASVTGKFISGELTPCIAFNGAEVL